MVSKTPDDRLVRLIMLRDIAIPYAAEMEKIGRLDLDVYWGEPIEDNPTCESVGCVLGHMATIPEFKAMGWSLGIDGFPEWRDFFGHEAAMQFFGMTSLEAEWVFGVATQGTLKERRDEVDELIRIRTAKSSVKG